MVQYKERLNNISTLRKRGSAAESMDHITW